MSKNKKIYMNRQLRAAYEEAYAIKDKEIKAQNTLRVEFYRSALWRLFLGSVRVRVPNHWSIDYFRYNFFTKGTIGLTKLKGVVVPFAYSVVERNRWKYPTVIRSEDEVNLGTRRIDNNTEILYLSDANFGGEYAYNVCSMIDIYAEKLANCDGSIDTNLLVSRTPYLFGVENEEQAQDMRVLTNRIFSGVPAIFYKLTRKGQDPLAPSDLPLTRLPVKENFVTLDMQDAKRGIIDEFLTLIGVNNANTDKRERLLVDEVNANNAELFAAVGLWQDNVNRQIEAVKRKFGDSLDGDLEITFGVGKGLNNGSIDRPNGNIPNNQRQNVNN